MLFRCFYGVNQSCDQLLNRSHDIIARAALPFITKRILRQRFPKAPEHSVVIDDNATVLARIDAVCARYRDIVQLVASLLQIALFVTPILWDPSQLTGRASILADYNPLYHLVAIVRDPLLGKAPELTHWIVAAFIAIIGWTATIQMLSKFRHRIVYWL